MTRAVLIHTADGPGAIAAGKRDVREPRIGEVLSARVRLAVVLPAELAEPGQARRRKKPMTAEPATVPADHGKAGEPSRLPCCEPSWPS